MATSKSSGPTQFQFDYGSLIIEAEKEFNLVESSPTRERVMSDQFVIDLIMGGGFAPGRMFTIAGMESCGKSTTMQTLLRAAGMQEVGFINYWDYEGSFDRTYMANMVNDERVAGILDNRMRVWPKNHGEDFFNAQGEILRRMPDKKFVNDRWWLAFPHEKRWIEFFSEENQKKDPSRKYDKELMKQYGMYFLPSNGNPQGLIIVDSWANMVPKDMDETDASNKMSPEAQMFAKLLKQVVGKLEEKRVILVGANQLREKPASQGNPFYEPGGRALEFNSSGRIWQHRRVNGPDENNVTEHEKGVHYEPSVMVEGAEDRYVYVLIENRKNKTAIPYITGWGRLWIRDGENRGRGWCPVFDAWWAMLMMGHIRSLDDGKNVKMKAFTLDLPANEELGCKPLTIKKLGWMDFKRLVLLRGDALRAHCQELGITEPPRIRDRIRNAIKNGDYQLNNKVT